MFFPRFISSHIFRKIHDIKTAVDEFFNISEKIDKFCVKSNQKKRCKTQKNLSLTNFRNIWWYIWKDLTKE